MNKELEAKIGANKAKMPWPTFLTSSKMGPRAFCAPRDARECLKACRQVSTIISEVVIGVRGGKLTSRLDFQDFPGMLQ